MDARKLPRAGENHPKALEGTVLGTHIESGTALIPTCWAESPHSAQGVGQRAQKGLAAVGAAIPVWHAALVSGKNPQSKT